MASISDVQRHAEQFFAQAIDALFGKIAAESSSKVHMLLLEELAEVSVRRYSDRVFPCLPDMMVKRCERTRMDALDPYLPPVLSQLVSEACGDDTTMALHFIRCVCNQPTILTQEELQITLLKNWCTVHGDPSDFNQLVCQTMLKAWPKFPIDKAPLSVIAEPVVHLANGDLLVEGDVFITQTTFHGVEVRAMGGWGATFDRGEFLVDNEGLPLCPDPATVPGLEIWATSREHPLYPTGYGYGGTSVEGSHAKTINRSDLIQPLSDPQLMELNLENALNNWRADSNKAHMLNKSDNFCSNGHPTLGYGFPMALPLFLLEGKKEGDIIDVRMVVNRIRRYDASVPLLGSPDRQICTVRLRCRQLGYRYGRDFRRDPILFEQKLHPFTDRR